MKFLCAIHSKWSRKGWSLPSGCPIADQPFEVLQVILVRCRHVGGIAAVDHDPLAVASRMDHGVARGRLSSPAGDLSLAMPFSTAMSGPRKRIDSMVTVIVAPGCSLNSPAYTFSIAAPPWKDWPDSSVYSASAAQRAPTALASAALKALTNASAVARIAFSSASLSLVGRRPLPLGAVRPLWQVPDRPLGQRQRTLRAESPPKKDSDAVQ